MRVKVCTFVCALGLVALLPAAAVSAEEAAPTLMVVEHTTVDPADIPEFEAWFKDWVAAFQAAGLGAEYNWYTSMGPGSNYVWVTPIATYSVLGRQEENMKEMTEAIGEEKIGQLFSKMHLMKSYHRELLRIRSDLSYAGPADADLQAAFIRIFVHHVRPGMEERYETLMKRVVEGSSKAKQPHGWDAYAVEFGEGSYVYTAIAGSAAEFHERPKALEVLTKSFGEEEAGRILAEWRECVSAFSERDAAPRPELSYVAAPAGE